MGRSKNVLLLNQDYSPLSICNVEKAFLLVFLKKAELVVEDQEWTLRTVTTTFPVPSVVRLNRYINLPYRGVVLTRHNVFKRDAYACQYCGVSRDLTLDHLVPRSKGGGHSWSNLVTACKGCNARKGDRTPKEAGMKLKKLPKKPSYLMFIRGFSNSSPKEWEPFLGF